MVNSLYVPERGDLVWLNFSPQTGHEQAGPRPALVMSPKSYHKLTGLGVVCPITSKQKGRVFELVLPSSGTVNGVILVDQVRNVDFASRDTRFIGKADAETVQEAQAYLSSLLFES